MKLEEGYYASPRWTYEILDCAMPMTFDTFSNCAHQCIYCFSFFQRAIGDTANDYLHHKVRAVNVERIKQMFLDPDKHGGQFAPYIKRRMTMQWGGLSDGFDWYERKFHKSLELLKFFVEIDYPVSISTKGVWFLDKPEYREVLKGAKNTHWKYSIITDNEEHVRLIEPGTPTAAERFNALRKLNELGVGATTLRFRPFILGTSDKCIDSMFRKGSEAGCYSVTTEFLTWESRASNTSRERLDVLSKVLGYDVWEFYKEQSARASGLLRLNYDLKRPYILEMKETAAKYNLKFFVSDAHHKEDSYHAGCCGLPESGPLSNVNYGQYAHAIKIAKEKGFVHWSDISEQAKDVLGKIPVIQAEGFPSDTAERAKRHYQNMYDYMQDIWNNPKSWQSPARYFGGALVPSAPDENGDIIYLYNKPFIEEGIRVSSVNELGLQLRMLGKPNADRYDEMTADGSDFGHVAYPILVFSRGRAKYATTPAILDSARLSNWHLVVEESEYKEYEKAFPFTDILILPDDIKDIVAARKHMAEIYKERGTQYIWMLDDDIQHFITLDENGEEKSRNPRAFFSGLEAFANQYENIAVLGPNNSSPRGNFAVNTLVEKAVLINVFAAEFPSEIKMKGLAAYQMAALSSGEWTTVENNLFNVLEAPGVPGGAAGLYLKGFHDKAVQWLHEQYPENTEILPVSRPFVSEIVVINNWQNSLISRAVKEFVNANS